MGSLGCCLPSHVQTLAGRQPVKVDRREEKLYIKEIKMLEEETGSNRQGREQMRDARSTMLVAGKTPDMGRAKRGRDPEMV